MTISGSILSLPGSLLSEIERRYGVAITAVEPLAGGCECDVALLTTAAGASLVLRVSPPERSVEELAWAFDLAAFAATRIPETVAPLAARDGALVFSHAGRPVSLFPFVPGRLLDRDDPRERDEAARLLGQLHRVLPDWPDLRPRPRSPDPLLTTPDVASATELARQAAVLPDAALDDFFARWRARRHPPVPLHADFYRGNLLCAERRITGLLDWDDARISSPEYELAWSVWEFAQAAPPGMALDARRAGRFLDAYAETGPVDVSDRDFVIPLIRTHLRFEILRAAAEREQGRPVDDEYVQREMAAFDALRTQTI